MLWCVVGEKTYINEPFQHIFIILTCRLEVKTLPVYILKSFNFFTFLFYFRYFLNLIFSINCEFFGIEKKLIFIKSKTELVKMCQSAENSENPKPDGLNNWNYVFDEVSV